MIKINLKTQGFLIFLLLNSLSVFSQTRNLTGRVVDQSNKPIPNANVIIFGTPVGTSTNYLGYFQLPIESSQKSLVISSIGYVTGKIDIPTDEMIKIVLDRNYVKIPDFDLSSFKHEDKPEPSGWDHTETVLLELDAEYPGRWDYFFNDLGYFLKSDSVAELLSVNMLRVRFSVGKDGRITQVFTPDSVTLPEPIRNSFLKLRQWQPALQNKIPVAQHFELLLGRKEIFTEVDEMPSFVGGLDAMFRYINRSLRYPPGARNLGVSGKVFVEFIVEKDGSITNVKVAKGIGAGCDEEAIRVIANSPKWLPGHQQGKPVRVRFVIPIAFKLNGSIERSAEQDFHDFIAYETKFPEEARKNNIEGWVAIRFRTNRETKQLSSFEVVEDIGGGYAQEVIRVLKLVPQSILSRINFKSQIIVIPVSFGLEESIDFKHLKYKKHSSEELMEPINIIALGIDNKIYRYIGEIHKAPEQSFEEIIKENPKSLRITLVKKNLDKIPLTINQLTSLKHLDLEGNLIKELPKELTELNKLQELFLPLNQLKELPESFADLSSLKMLGLAGNKIEVFPMSITKLPKLEALELTGNQITYIPAEIVNLKDLKLLFLQNNRIETVPEELFQLKHLQKLFLMGNKLSDATKALIKKRLPKTIVDF